MERSTKLSHLGESPAIAFVKRIRGYLTVDTSESLEG
jgi:hypothetical protein